MGTQPDNASIGAGETAEFSVTASGTDLTYQWQYMKNGDGVWHNSTSATTGYNTDTLKVVGSKMRDGYQYRCVVTDPYGRRLISDTATLEVIYPEISSQPQDASVGVDTTATFSVTATGKGLTYQWQYKKSESDSWHNSTSATVGCNTDTLKVVGTAMRNGYQYRCVVTDYYGSKVTSSAAKLTIFGPVINKQPQDAEITVGATATFKVVATGTGLTYRWQYKKNASDSWHNSTSATTGYNTATLQVAGTAMRNGYQYRCVIMDDYGLSITSDTVRLTIAGPVINIQPQDANAAEGETATFRVVATGTGLTYQWQYKKNASDTWHNSTSATAGYNTAVLTVVGSAMRDGYQYRCVVTDYYGSRVTSNAATLTVTS